MRVQIVCRQDLAVIVAGITLATINVRLPASEKEPVSPLTHAHAHNDYWHERPLIDALERGFCSVEVDIYLKDGALLVGHDPHELRKKRTLQALYLEPLRDRIRRNEGHVHGQASAFYLLVDIKSDAMTTYAAVHELLADYSDILTTVRDGTLKTRAVTVIISGNRDEVTIRSQPVRYAGIDGRPADLDRDEPAHVMPWISANWNQQFQWKGDGPMPEAERTKLREYVTRSHRRGRQIRFWATPEDERVWKELRAADVDLIGTDDLDRLHRFFSTHK